MKDDLTWYDLNIIWRTKSYKDFVQKMLDTAREEFCKDGERIFTDKEKKFLQIYNFKNGTKEILASLYLKIKILKTEPQRIESKNDNSILGIMAHCQTKDQKDKL